MGSSGEGQVLKLSVVCLHNNAIVARGILGTIVHCGTLEPRLSAICSVSSVGISFKLESRSTFKSHPLSKHAIIVGVYSDWTRQRQIEASLLILYENDNAAPPL